MICSQPIAFEHLSILIGQFDLILSPSLYCYFLLIKQIRITSHYDYKTGGGTPIQCGLANFEIELNRLLLPPPPPFSIRLSLSLTVEIIIELNYYMNCPVFF